MSNIQDEIYALIEASQSQQTAVQKLLDGLVAERAKLASAVAALGQSTREAVHSAVALSFAGAADEGVAAVRTATQPLLGELAGVTREALRAEAALRRVASWVGFRLLGWITGLMITLVLIGWLTGYVMVWWDTGKVNELQNQITEMQANHDALVQAGMLNKLIHCYPGNRLCVEVDDSAGLFPATPGGPYDARVLMGY